MTAVTSCENPLLRLPGVYKYDDFVLLMVCNQSPNIEMTKYVTFVMVHKKIVKQRFLTTSMAIITERANENFASVSEVRNQYQKCCVSLKYG